MPVKAVLYARVSTDAQAEDDRQSLPVQREEFLTRCTERGYEAAEVFVDVQSGREVDRKAYQRLLAAAGRREFDVIVVTFLDRFGRDEWEIMGALRDLRRLGIEIDAIHDDTSEFIMVALSAWKAGAESKRIGERVKATMQRAVREGKPMGQFPYGYRRHRDDDGFHMLPHPDHAPVVREIYRLYVVEALSMAQIQRHLNAEGIPGPRSATWTVETVRNVLARPTYTGMFVYGEARVQQGYEPLIDQATWDAAQARRELRRGLPAGRTHRSDYLLSGVIYCAHCQGRMEGNTSVIRSYTYRRYTCATYRKRQLCAFRNQHDADKLEAAVLTDLLALVEQDAGVQRESHVQRLRADLSATEKAIGALPERFVRNMRLFDSGAIASEAQLRLANQRLEADQQHLNAERIRLTEALEAEEADDLRAVALPALAHALRDGWGPMTPAQRKALILDLIERVEVTTGSYEARIDLRSASLITG